MAGTVFVGRHGERERLASVLRGDPGSAGAALVTGDAGIGKSRLLAEVEFAVPDVAVLAGSCLPMSVSLPYGAITDAFDHLAGPAGRPVLDKALDRCAPFVAPQIAALIPAISAEAHPPLDAMADRTRLFAAVRDLLAALGAARRTALVVEDLHWADAGTLDLLTFLVRSLPDGIALVATSRRDELTADSPVLEWLDTTSRLPGVEHVTLIPLPDDDVASMVASLVDGQAASTFVADVERRGQGNPFFTEQLVAAARDVASPLERSAVVPAGVRQMLLARVRSVGAAGSEVAAVLAVAARPLGEQELAACVGIGVAVPSGLRNLLDTHLAEPAEQDRYRLRHALLEDAVRETLLASQRATLHAEIASVLAAREGVENPGEVAAHWRAAGNRVEEAHWSVASARRAEDVYSWAEASTAWRRVWELWELLEPNERPPVDLPEVVVRSVTALRRTDDTPALLRVARQALADHRVTADDHATGVLLRQYGWRLIAVDQPAGIAALQRSVATFDRAGQPSAEQARALFRLVRAKEFSGAKTGTEAQELARATAIADQVGSLDVQLELATRHGSALIEDGRVDEGLAELRTVLERVKAGGPAAGEQWTALILTDAYLWLLRLHECVEMGRGGLARALAQGHRGANGFGLVAANTVEALLLLGDLTSAAEITDAYLLPVVTNGGWPFHAARAELDVLADDQPAALARVGDIESLGNQNDDMVMWLSEVGALADLWQGKPQLARNRIDSACDAVLGSPLAIRAGRMLMLAARAAADIADSRPGAARGELGRRLEERAEQMVCFAPHPARVLSAAYCTTFDAELARLKRSEEEPAWRAAKGTWASHGVPHQAAYAGWRLARCLLDRARRNDAQDELVAAYAAAQQHEPLRREIEALARRARLPLEAAPQQPAATGTSVAAPGGLTPRELDVLRLLGTGASNDQIAHRLYISPKTASVHVSHIFRKLGVTGRVQAAMVAERMGLLTTGAEDGRAP